MNQGAQCTVVDNRFEVVRVLEKLAEFDGNADGLLGWNRAAPDQRGQVFAVEILHRDVIAGFMIPVFENHGNACSDLA